MSTIFDNILKDDKIELEKPKKKPGPKPQKRKKKPTTTKKSKTKKENPKEIVIPRAALHGKSIIEDKPEVPAGGNDMDDLYAQAQEAQLMEAIYKSELVGYKVQKEKMNLEIAAGDLMETSFAKFLFFSYMEKCNTDLLNMPKRLEAIIVNLVKEGDYRKLIKRLEKEIQSTLIEIKKAQKKDIAKWKADLK
jgi:hypothetical protein